jgi:hypothetical protein
MKIRYWISLTILLAVTNVYAELNDTDADVMKADTNKDGKVSFEEFEAAHKAALIERFKSRDINNDGFIDLEEKQVAQEKKKEEQQAEQEEETKKLKEKYAKDRETRKKHFYKYQ